jgi:hypothetical protein
MKNNMTKISLLLIFLALSSPSGMAGCPAFSEKDVVHNTENPDTLYKEQILYNGREWKDLYYKVQNGQFLFSRLFLPATVTMQGRTFTRLQIRYDIYNDEITLPTDQGIILQLNKEMVDSFSVIFANETYHFVRLPEDSTVGIGGYLQVVYLGRSRLYAKYIKKLNRPETENSSDNFYQIMRLYAIIGGKSYLFTKRHSLFRQLRKSNPAIRSYIRKNRSSLNLQNPTTFVPLMRALDQLNP